MDVLHVGGGLDDPPSAPSTPSRRAPPRNSRRAQTPDFEVEDVETPVSRPGTGKRAKKANKPALTTETTSLDGRDFLNDIREMSPQARHVVRQLEKRGWVRVDEIHPDDLVAISKWFGKEVGVLQSPYTKGLRVVLGTSNGVLMREMCCGAKSSSCTRIQS